MNKFVIVVVCFIGLAICAGCVETKQVKPYQPVQENLLPMLGNK